MIVYTNKSPNKILLESAEGKPSSETVDKAECLRHKSILDQRKWSWGIEEPVFVEGNSMLKEHNFDKSMLPPAFFLASYGIIMITKDLS
jgi:hypothetical protein